MSRLTLIQPGAGRRVLVSRRICSDRTKALRLVRSAMTVLVIDGMTKLCLKEAI